jgi:ferritin-like protein
LAGSSAELHEQGLSPETIDRHRAIVSLMEELEAVDWYDQRAEATTDEGLKAILEHNRDEEKEHAVMTLEWLRRRDPALDAVLRQYLFTEGPIVGIEEAVTGKSGGPTSGGPGGSGTAVGGLRDGKELL